MLRLFGAAGQTVQQAAGELGEEGALRVQCRSRGGETLIALAAKTPERLQAACQKLRQRFAADCYGEGEKGLADAVVPALEQHGRLLVCGDAEAGALLEARLENVPGAEKIFDFGRMSYADAAVNAKIIRRARRRGDDVQQSAARVQAALRIVEADIAAGCAEQGEEIVLLVGSRKGCWRRTVSRADAPGLWLLDMIRRAACGLPQAEGTVWQKKRGHRLRRIVWGLIVLLAAALAAAWYYTGGDLTALPQLLRADSLPHSGAKLI